jgi:hypothetical protein
MDLSSFRLASPAPWLRSLIQSYWMIDVRHIGPLSRNDLMRVEGGSGWVLVLDGQLNFETGGCAHGAVFDAGVDARPILSALRYTLSWEAQVSILNHWLTDLMRRPTDSDMVMQHVIGLIFKNSVPLPVRSGG